MRPSPASSVPRAVAAAVTALALGAAGLALAAPASAASAGVLINEVYGGGGNTGAPLSNDFIELQNRGATAVDVTGWTVQYTSSSGTAGWQTTALSGSIAPGGYLLVQEAGTVGAALPGADAAGSILLSATSGTVALSTSGERLTCTTSAACSGAATLVDLVGYGAAKIFEGATAAPGIDNATSAQRGTAADTDVNGVDVAAGAPTPKAQNSTGTTTPPGDPTPGTTRIHDLQGPGYLSPLDGAAVERVPGIVTGVRTAGSKGFYLQDPTADADPRTSEGIFVYTGSIPTVAVGDSVLVSATVDDFNVGGNPADPSVSTMSVTELTRPTITVLSRGVALPAPIALTPTTVPEPYAPDLGGADLEKAGPIQPSRSALDFYESIEGMRASVTDARVTGPSNSFGEQYVTTKPGQNASPRGGTVLEADNATPSGRIQLVTPSGTNLGLRVGDVIAGTSAGPIDYSKFGGYSLVAVSLGTLPATKSLQRTTASPQNPDQLSVATYNVENLAPKDDPEKYAALASGIVSNLASPDIVTVEEVQDDSGATDDGVVAADTTLATLTAAIATAGGPRYQWRQIDPVNDRDGGQPGGNIRIAFLYNPERVSFIDRGDASVDRSTTATAVTRSLGAPRLTLSPGRIDPGSDAWTDSRKPLVGEFRFRGEPVFVIGNHWNSKGGDQSADGRFQYPTQSSRIQRQKQAAEVREFTAELLKADRNAKVVVAGDLNDYQFSPPLKTLTSGGILTDLVTTLPEDEQYTYVFNGVSQVLDHILVSKGAGRVEYEVVHLNAEFEDQVSDHDPQVVRLTVRGKPTLPVCTPSALALSYSDRLDKLARAGATLGGLSSLAYDRRSGAYVSAVDNHLQDPARLWFVSSPYAPRVVRDPLILKRSDGIPYTGETSDFEGLAVLPDGDYLISSETEPSLRVFGRDGVQRSELPIPARFRVAPAGEATANATLEGLTISKDGRTVIAAMEGALSGDSSASDATAHRFLVYTQDRKGAWTLSRQVAYRADAGLRIPEIVAYDRDSLLVEEAAYDGVTGNTVKLYAITGLARATDVSSVASLSAAPASVFPAKKLVADLVTCPTLGAKAKQFQANPLLDNYEGMAITGGGLFGGYTVSLISDDNFQPTQITRVLNLAVRLP